MLLALPYAAIGLVAPYGAALALQAVWLLLLGVLWAARRSEAALFVPLGAAALLPLTVTVGESLLGWTA